MRAMRTAGLGVVCAAVVSLWCGGPALAAGSAPRTPGAPAGCSAAELTSRAYSPMLTSNNLYVFDTRPQLKVEAIVSGLSAPGEMVVGNGGRTLYIDDWGTGSVRVMDACTLTTTKLIPVGGDNIISYIPANGSQFNGRYMYVSSVTDSTVSVIDTFTNTVVRNYPVPGILNLHLSPDGRTLYVMTATAIETLDPQTGTPIGPTSPNASRFTTWLTTSPDGRLLYTADTGGDSLSVLNAQSMAVLKTTTLPSGTAPVVVKDQPRGGLEVWMASIAYPDGITVYSAFGNLLKVIPTDGLSPYVSFSPDGSLAYVDEAGSCSKTVNQGLLYLYLAVQNTFTCQGDIRVFSTFSLTQVGPTVPVGEMPGDLATLQPGTVSGG